MKLLIWGTGRLVGKVVGRYIDIENVSGFIDNDNKKTEYMGKKVYSPLVLKDVEYDAICVANLFAEDIYRQCKELKINTDKVIFLYSNCKLQDMNKDYHFVKHMLGEEYADIIAQRYHVVRGVEAYGDLFLKDTNIFFGGGIKLMTMFGSRALSWQ